MIAPRSPVMQLGIRAATPLALIVAIYLLIAGHNDPGGGFAAGLVLGSVVALRVVVGLPGPGSPYGLISVGVLFVTLTVVAPLLFGNLLLDQVIWKIPFGPLGTFKTGSAFPFDIGVTLIVVGLMVAILDGLGADELVSSPLPTAEDYEAGARAEAAEAAAKAAADEVAGNEVGAGEVTQ
jgi:multicomponent Na+:H+ antiporter subunit A